MRIFKKVVLGLFIVIAMAIIGLVIWLQTTKPVYSGELKLNGLSAPVTIYHDDNGVPHIYGANEIDTYRAFGYLVAQERLFQMEMVRRVSSGRLSEILGSSMIDVDRFFRMLGITQHADASAKDFFSTNNEAWQQAALAYLDGINQFIENGKTPLEFRLVGIEKEKYTIRDLFLIVDYMSFNFQMGFRTDPLLSRIDKRLGPGYVDQLTLGYTPDQLRNPVNSNDSGNSVLPAFTAIIEKLPVKIWTGSNAFAVAPSRSKSGKAVLENDTHIGQQQPGVWFDAHLNYPGTNFYGSYLAGFPFAPLGHTPTFGWGVTMLENDDIDFFRESVSTIDSNTILINGRPEKMQLRDEVIRVKDSADVRILCRTTSHGPICSDVMSDFKSYTSSPISASWTLLKFPCNLFEVTYNLDHAKNMAAFREQAGKIASPGLNIIYADTTGNIAWYAVGKLVKRAPGTPCSLVLDGSDSANYWQGFYDFSDNPKSENPPQGYVFSCNHQPDTFHGNFHAGYYLTDERARRLDALLNSQPTFNREDLERIALDVTNPHTVVIAQQLLSLIPANAINRTNNTTAVAGLLRNWQGTHSMDDRAPAIYYMFLYKSMWKMMGDEIGAKDFDGFLKTHTIKYSVLPLLKNDTTKWWDDITTPSKETREQIIAAAFEETVNDLTTQFSSDPANWSWGKFHVLEFGHPIGKMKPMNYFFNVGPIPTAGGMETINNQAFLLTDKFPVTVLYGPALRRTIDFSRPLNGYSILPSGQSGNPMSRHYDDQALRYADGKSRREYMDEQEIRSVCKDVLIFR